ncbi:ATPase, T2SS/T4P/T4SS family [Iodobacter sp. CM08]|uniref:GspE/PulE family protein n=1 Tax=Iodobacter sp. CM08 TaxID=3085902 RepID=UPI002982AB7C|nr:ATPase, T2SS/T4P/T4SS family [Iodobacter sp. CM08]MDW5418082.1 ATPase, T2SS/T4P/T4SS family [Iodobacter sp. CM08]
MLSKIFSIFSNKKKLLTSDQQVTSADSKNSGTNKKLAGGVEVHSIGEMGAFASNFDPVELTSKNSNIVDFLPNEVVYWRTSDSAVVVFDKSVMAEKKGHCSALIMAIRRESKLDVTTFIAEGFLIPLLMNQISQKELGEKEKDGKVAPNFVALKEIVKLGATLNASDIHFFARKKARIGEGVQIVFRIDGDLVRSNYQVDYPTCLSIIKSAWEQSATGANQGSIFSENSIQKTGIPVEVELEGQNGEKKNEHINLRFQSLPASDGFDVTLRLLWQSGGKIHKGKTLFDDLIKLGFLEDQSELIELILRKNSGGVVWGGPTGSGKTTSMYTCINHLVDGNTKIITAEDPVECKIYGTTQSQVTPKMNPETNSMQTKDQALTEIVEGILRSDPNITMISEIRGKDTGSAFEQLVESGHLTLSSLHIDNPLGAFNRLSGQKIGIDLDTLTTPNFLLGVIYQQLLKKLCPLCSVPLERAVDDGTISLKYKATLNTLLSGHISNIRIRNEEGCHCCKKGNYDRTVCASILVPNYELLELINSKKKIEAIRYVESMAGPLWEPASIGKSAYEIAVYKMSIGEIDPREIEANIEPHEFYLRNKKSNSSPLPTSSTPVDEKKIVHKNRIHNKEEELIN